VNLRDKRTNSSDGAGGCFLLIIIGLLVWYLGPWESSDKKEIESLEKLNQAQNEQIETLKRSQLALEDLIEFVQKEKSDAETKAKELKSDIERLRDLQKVDQETVNKIFEEQQKQKEREKWTEWTIAFVIGILSTVAFELLRKALGKLRGKSEVD
jgi:Mg2+/citrate symporter